MNAILLTTADLAARWQIQARTLSNWRMKGRGPAFVKMGAGRNTRVMYRLEDVESFERSNRKEMTK